MKRQPVITGLGIVSPIGVGVEKFWAAAKAGKSGIRTPTLFDGSKLPQECRMVGEVRDFNPRDWVSSQTVKIAGRFSQFAVAAAKMALKDSSLESSEIEPERFMVSMGTSMSGLVDIEHSNFLSFLRGEEMRPWTVLEYPGHAATSHVAISVGARGQTASIATACAAGIDAVGWAAEKVSRNKASVVLAGATETPLAAASIEAFRALGALSSWSGPPAEASRPFDKLRSGLVLAEGSATVVVEDEATARARRAPIYARILGSGSVTEGVHMRNVDATGEPAARAMELALKDADLAPEDIDYVCAHGNSLIDYDASETAGIKLAFGKRAWCLPISSIKSMCGQALAASGAMQIVASCLAIRDNTVPPTINYEFRDPACDLDYVPNVARAVRVRTVLIHAQSIGGSHVAMILGAPC
ncbi:MAG TPA: beta-ketoacyl-[acyl-carrier-protein] synthase family protein [Steroidobacteraceae bacterium]